MHPENELTNHGKQVTRGAQSQISSVNQQGCQESAGNQGSKSTRSGSHEVKTNQISSSNPDLKSVGQSGSAAGVGRMMKTKAKRDRTMSLDVADQKDTLASVLESEAKVEGIIRSKRRCVLEKKQPYSGDEWCSGAESEEEERPLSTTHREHVSTEQSLSSAVSSAGEKNRQGLGCALRPGVHSDQPLQQVVYVFTTNLANSAAEAVMHGQTESIVLFHQQNVPRTKLDQQCTGVGNLPNILEQLSSNSTPTMGTPKSQSCTPRPASVGIAAGPQACRNSPSSTGHPEDEGTPVRSGGTPSYNHPLGPGGVGPHRVGAQGCGIDGSGGINYPGSGASPRVSPILSAHIQCEGSQSSTDGLSKEQLEHRERSLQTLRDIEKLLLRSGAGASHGESGGPNNNPNNGSVTNNNPEGCRGLENREVTGLKVVNSGLSTGVTSIGGMKRHEPLQSLISQTQNLSGPSMDDTLMLRHPNLSPQHQLSSPSELDMGPMLGPEGLTPEQIAWRKLQEDYYQEKRRRQEINPHRHSQHFHMMPEMGMPGGPHLIIRGPPPPYHSKPGDQQWGQRPLIAGGMEGNLRMMDLHQEGPRGPRFVGQRGPPASGYPGSPGAMLPIDGLGPQRSPRPAISWLDDLPPNMAGVSQFHGCYPPGGPGGPPQQMQSGLDRALTREEIFHIMEKRQLQGLCRLDLEQLSRQQHQRVVGGPRIMDNPRGPGFPNPGMGGGQSSREDAMNFPNSQSMMNSPIDSVGGGGGPLVRDMVTSPLGGNLNMNTRMNINLQQQMLVQKLREGSGPEMLSPEDNSRIRAMQNGQGGANRLIVPGPDGQLQFPMQNPYSGGEGDGSNLQPEMFGSDQGPPQISGTSRLTHLPMNTGQKGSDLGSRHPSDLSVNVNSIGSPALPPSHQLKSPSLSHEPSTLIPSPSAPSLKSPKQPLSTGPPHPPLPVSSGAGTPTPTSMKSPQIMGSSLGLQSPSCSPGHLKSPAMPIASPRWTASPKTTMASPGGNTSSKGVGNEGNSETSISLPNRSSTSTPSGQPPNMPFTSSPGTIPSQNHLSLIMSQMSKYAMPSSTPLYHEAIKTIATSDDEMPPDRLLLPGTNVQGNMVNHQSSQMLLSSQRQMEPHSSPSSPTEIILQGNQLSLEPPGPLQPSPNPMVMPVMIGSRGGPPDGIGPCNMSPMHPPNQMGGFPRIQAPLHSPIDVMVHQYPPSSEETLPAEPGHFLSKAISHQRPPHPSDSFTSISINEGPDLSEVIRPTHTGIPEFDLSRIIPADKPSSTLQYFPKSELMSQLSHTLHQGQLPQHAPSAQLLKQLSSSGPTNSSMPSSNPHIANLQNMMAEQQLSLQTSHCGVRPGLSMAQGGSRGMNSSGGMGPGHIYHPGHPMGRTSMPLPQQQHYQQQQAMMPSSLLQHQSYQTQGILSPQQHPHNLIAQQNMMMMQAKQRGMPIPGEHYGQQGALMSPPGPMIGPPHPQSIMMGPQGMRQRGLSLDSPLDYGPGGMANMPF